jgi:hypothetical protein
MRAGRARRGRGSRIAALMAMAVTGARLSDVARVFERSRKRGFGETEFLKIGCNRSYAGILTWFRSSQRVENVSLRLKRGWG